MRLYLDEPFASMVFSKEVLQDSIGELPHLTHLHVLDIRKRIDICEGDIVGLFLGKLYSLVLFLSGSR